MLAENIVIVGAGQAGGCAAATLRSSGFKGRISLIGDEGHPPYERPPLSKSILDNTMALEKLYLQRASWYADAGISLRINTRVASIDRARKAVNLASGEEIGYDALLLTMGARARRLSIIEPSSNIFYLRDIEDALALRARLRPAASIAVIGAGFIGLEVAATARKRGCDVTVFEVGSRVLGRVAPKEISQYVLALHQSRGVEFEFCCAISRIEGNEQCLIHLQDGRQLRFDAIVVGIGAVPNVELALGAGLAVDDGIVVDEYGRTDDASVFAAGDVTKHFNPSLGRHIRLEAWQNAQNQAIAVAKILSGGSAPFSEIPWLWSDQFEMNMQIAGAPLAWDEVVVRGDMSSGSFTLFQLADEAVVGAIAVNSARDMRFSRRLVGRDRKVEKRLLADPLTDMQSI